MKDDKGRFRFWVRFRSMAVVSSSGVAVGRKRIIVVVFSDASFRTVSFIPLMNVATTVGSSATTTIAVSVVVKSTVLIGTSLVVVTVVEEASIGGGGGGGCGIAVAAGVVSFGQYRCRLVGTSFE